MRNPLLTGLGVVLLLGLSACGVSVPATPTSVPPTATVPPAAATVPPAAAADPGIVTKALAIAQIKGHLYASLSNWQAKRYDLAVRHGKHPGEELLALLTPDLRAKGIPTDFQQIFDQYTALMAGEGDAAIVQTAFDSATKAIDTANRAYLGSLADDPAFNGQVVARLIDSIEGDYSQALQNGVIANLPEYQDAKGFLTVAEERYAAVTGTVVKSNAEEDAQIRTHLQALGAALPDYMTPPSPAVPLDQVEAATDGVGQELNEVFAWETPPAGQETDLIAGARQAVSTALATAAAGQTDQAYEQAAAAYLDNFEKLEGPLGQKDAALVAELEGQFKALREGIKAGKSATELQAIAAAINAGLDKAATLLSGSTP